MTDEMVAYQSPTGMETALGEFSGMAPLGDMSDEERRQWFIENDIFFIE